MTPLDTFHDITRPWSALLLAENRLPLDWPTAPQLGDLLHDYWGELFGEPKTVAQENERRFAIEEAHAGRMPTRSIRFLKGVFGKRKAVRLHPKNYVANQLPSFNDRTLELRITAWNFEIRNYGGVGRHFDIQHRLIASRKGIDCLPSRIAKFEPKSCFGPIWIRCV